MRCCRVRGEELFGGEREETQLMVALDGEIL